MFTGKVPLLLFCLALSASPQIVVNPSGGSGGGGGNASIGGAVTNTSTVVTVGSGTYRNNNVVVTLSSTSTLTAAAGSLAAGSQIWIEYDPVTAGIFYVSNANVTQANLTRSNITAGISNASGFSSGRIPLATCTAGTPVDNWTTCTDKRSILSTVTLNQGTGISITPQADGSQTITSTSAGVTNLRGTYSAFVNGGSLQSPNTLCNAANNGQIYHITDTGISAHCNGTAWGYFKQDIFITPPDLSSFALTVGSPTVSQALGIPTLTAPLVGTEQQNCKFTPVPGSTPYTVTADIAMQDGRNNDMITVALYEQSTTKFAHIGGYIDESTGSQWVAWSQTGNTGARTGQYNFSIASPPSTGLIRLRIINSGTTLTLGMSLNGGLAYTNSTAIALATFFTTAPTHYGVCANSLNGTYNAIITPFNLTAQ